MKKYILSITPLFFFYIQSADQPNLTQSTTPILPDEIIAEIIDKITMSDDYDFEKVIDSIRFLYNLKSSNKAIQQKILEKFNPKNFEQLLNQISSKFGITRAAVAFALKTPQAGEWLKNWFKNRIAFLNELNKQPVASDYGHMRINDRVLKTLNLIPINAISNPFENKYIQALIHDALSITIRKNGELSSFNNFYTATYLLSKYFKEFFTSLYKNFTYEQLNRFTLYDPIVSIIPEYDSLFHSIKNYIDAFWFFSSKSNEIPRPCWLYEKVNGKSAYEEILKLLPNLKKLYTAITNGKPPLNHK